MDESYGLQVNLRAEFHEPLAGYVSMGFSFAEAPVDAAHAIQDTR